MAIHPLQLLLAVSFLAWMVRFGGPGLILLGIADSSVIPLTGSMDVLTIWLAASRRELWPYYALMATIGAMAGGYLTYSLASKGGREALERKISKKKIERVYKKFETWGFGAVAVPAMLPPPFPIVPFLLAAGALQYSRKKFLGALALGRGVRFFVVAALGAIYGKHIVYFFSRYYKTALFTLIALAAIGGVISLIKYWKYRNKQGKTLTGNNIPTSKLA
ncbi:MAG TPA: VTT domain-containing protein [Terriglobales bacterium]|jgi:membrane protein YqaA with SNARE-associated domain